MLLLRKGVSNPGQEEKNENILQHQLAAGEPARWISLANDSDLEHQTKLESTLHSDHIVGS